MASNYDWSTYLSQRGRPGALLQLLASATPAEVKAAPKKITVGTPAKPKSGKGSPGQIKELFYDPQGGWKNGSRIAAIGGHSDHVHVAAEKRRVEYLGRIAQGMGLRVSEQDKFGGRPSGGHAPNSWHYSGQAIFDSVGGGVWPFLVGGVICLVNFDNE